MPALQLLVRVALITSQEVGLDCLVVLKRELSWNLMPLLKTTRF